jgi:hypothetical protein
MAVGYTGSTSVGPLAESWNGTSWSISTQSVGSPGGGNEFFGAIACPTVIFCATVGGWDEADGVAGGSSSWVWRRSHWVSVPTKTSLNGYLRGIACTSATSCLAAGASAPSSPLGAPYSATIQRWDGTAWTSIAGAAFGQQSSLNAVSCSRTNWCAAIGSMTTRTDATGHLVERWNGVTLNRMWAPG